MRHYGDCFLLTETSGNHIKMIHSPLNVIRNAPANNISVPFKKRKLYRRMRLQTQEHSFNDTYSVVKILQFFTFFVNGILVAQ